MAIPESARLFMSGLIERARKLKRQSHFPKATTPRVIEAAARLAREGLVRPVLVGPTPPQAPAGVEFVDPAKSPLAANTQRSTTSAAAPRASLKSKRRKSPASRSTSLLSWSAPATPMAVAEAPSTAPPRPYAPRCTPSVPTRARASSPAYSSWRCPIARSATTASSPSPIAPVVIDPSASQLADIAIATAESTRVLIHTEPAVALLSFSTKGSGKHPDVDRVVEAMRIAQARAPELNIDGELQADAAVSAIVGKSKAPGSKVAGRANTLIFPNLASANIGYKLVERLGGAMAIGPFMQGLAKPANDLSRGCSAEDIYNVAIVTALQSDKA
jgi:phosphate acetyltransferase